MRSMVEIRKDRLKRQKRIAERMRRMAKLKGVPVITATQINRSNEDFPMFPEPKRISRLSGAPIISIIDHTSKIR